MNAPLRGARVVLCAAMIGSVAHAQTTPGPAEPLLGRNHVILKFGRAFLSDDAAQEWGVSREEYFEVEGYHTYKRRLYLGGALGRLGTGTGVAADGLPIRDLHFRWLELNVKEVFDRKRGMSLDFGGGVALLYIDGEEVDTLSGPTITDPLADVGFGSQIFGDFNWRTRHLILGLDAKYQLAFDLVDVNYSNLRLGAHLGVAF